MGHLPNFFLLAAMRRLTEKNGFAYGKKAFPRPAFEGKLARSVDKTFTVNSKFERRLGRRYCFIVHGNMDLC
jgi:hypothetical protein